MKEQNKSLAASVKAQAYENAPHVFGLGQKVKHKVFGKLLLNAPNPTLFSFVFFGFLIYFRFSKYKIEVLVLTVVHNNCEYSFMGILFRSDFLVYSGISCLMDK